MGQFLPGRFAQCLLVAAQQFAQCTVHRHESAVRANKAQCHRRILGCASEDLLALSQGLGPDDRSGDITPRERDPLHQPGDADVEPAPITPGEGREQLDLVADERPTRGGDLAHPG